MIIFLKSWILNIASMCILLLILGIVIPSGKTKKNINLVTGLVLMISIINPLIKFFKNDFSIYEFQLSDSNAIKQKELQGKNKLFKENQMKQIISIYKKRILKDVELTINEEADKYSIKSDIKINEDMDSDQFGQIENIEISLIPRKKNDALREVVSIEKIQIGKKDEKSPPIDIDPKTSKNIIEKLNNVFKINKSNIQVLYDGE